MIPLRSSFGFAQDAVCGFLPAVVCPLSSVLCARTNTQVAGNKNGKVGNFFTPVATRTCVENRDYNFVDFLTIRAGRSNYGGEPFRSPAERRKFSV